MWESELDFYYRERERERHALCGFVEISLLFFLSLLLLLVLTLGFLYFLLYFFSSFDFCFRSLISLFLSVSLISILWRFRINDFLFFLDAMIKLWETRWWVGHFFFEFLLWFGQLGMHIHDVPCGTRARAFKKSV